VLLFYKAEKMKSLYQKADHLTKMQYGDLPKPFFSTL